MIDKEEFIKAYVASTGNVSTACNKANCSRAVYYKWMKEDPEFKERINEVDEGQLDFAETKLKQHIMEGNLTATIFYLKTKGRDRGYVERTEQDMNINGFEQLMKDLPDEEE